MELYQMRYFKVVAETEHFTRAAELLHISQPSLSKAISNLEGELGVPLFERDKRAVFLNDYGRAFLKRVNAILPLVDEAVEELRDMSGSPCGDVYIGSCAMFSEPSRIHAYTADTFLTNPGIALHLYIMETAKIEELLLDRKLDFGFSVTPPEHPEIDAVELFSYRLGAVVSRDHPLAGRASIHLRELANENFLCNNTSPDLRDSVYDLCHMAGFEPRVVFEGESGDLIGAAIAQGRGVAFISTDRHDWKARQHADNTDDVVFLEILDDFCVRHVYLFQLKGRYLPTAARTYRDGLLEFVQET